MRSTPSSSDMKLVQCVPTFRGRFWSATEKMLGKRCCAPTSPLSTCSVSTMLNRRSWGLEVKSQSRKRGRPVCICDLTVYRLLPMKDATRRHTWAESAVNWEINPWTFLCFPIPFPLHFPPSCYTVKGKRTESISSGDRRLNSSVLSTRTRKHTLFLVHKW